MERVKLTDPYTVLSAGYDLVMEHVDYEAWADYIGHVIDRHHEAPDDIVELGCGTGSLAIELVRLGFPHVLATDRSRAMLDVAERKARKAGVDVRFGQLDFRDFALERRADVLLLLYDGLNYLLEEADIQNLFRSARAALADGGIFVFDQSTPSNSLRNEKYFEDRGEEGDFRYERRSRYDAQSRLHTTTLDLFVRGEQFREEHVQRAYEIDEIRALLQEAGFDILAFYDGFSLDEAGEGSERVHWVVRKGEKQ